MICPRGKGVHVKDSAELQELKFYLYYEVFYLEQFYEGTFLFYTICEVS